MNISIICIGKLKEKYWKEALSEYRKRLKNYCNLNIVELRETRLPANSGEADETFVKFSEGQEILLHIDKSMQVITLEVKGKKLSSEAFAKKIDDFAIAGKSDVTFVIGGSLGLSEEVSARANFKLSFSDMTFPHQMMRVVLVEQIYRSFKINRNEPYHK